MESAALASKYTGIVPDTLLSPDGKPLPNVELEIQKGSREEIVSISSKKGAPPHVLLRAFVVEHDVKPKAKDMAQILWEAKNVAQAKRTILPSSAEEMSDTTLCNPNTKSGLIVNEGVIAMAEKARKNKLRMAEEKEGRESAKRQKTKEANIARDIAFIHVCALVEGCQDFNSAYKILNSKIVKAERLQMARASLENVLNKPDEKKKCEFAKTLAGYIVNLNLGNPTPAALTDHVIDGSTMADQDSEIEFGDEGDVSDIDGDEGMQSPSRTNVNLSHLFEEEMDSD